MGTRCLFWRRDEGREALRLLSLSGEGDEVDDADDVPVCVVQTQPGKGLNCPFWLVGTRDLGPLWRLGKRV
jgi:hypothetical protein